MDSAIRQVAVHAVNFRKVCTATDRADFHFQFLMTAIITVGQGQVHTFVKAHLHSPANQGSDRFNVVVHGITHVLDFPAVA